MDIEQAKALLSQAVDVGTSAAHGAGMITRHDVEQFNAAERAVHNYIDALLQANNDLAEALKVHEAKEPCDCEDKE